MKNRYNFLVGLLITALSLSSSSTYTAARTQHALRTVNIGLDVASKAITNLAMTNHIDNPAAAATMHAIASTVGIARDLALAKLLYDDPKNMLNGDHFALSSSVMANIIDLIVHCSNIKKSNPYIHVDTASRVGIRTAQALAILTNYFAHHSNSDLCLKQEFQTVMYNLHTGIEAVEKMLISEHCMAPIIDQQVIAGILVSSALLNAISAGYYTAQAATPKKDASDAASEGEEKDEKEEAEEEEEEEEGPAHANEPVVLPAAEIAGFVCPICLGVNGNNIIRLACPGENPHQACLNCYRDMFDAYRNATVDEDMVVEGERLEAGQPDRVRRAAFQEGNIICPECRRPAHIRGILHAHPAA
jgi:hypothetical protein